MTTFLLHSNLTKAFLLVALCITLSACGAKKTAAPELGDISYSSYPSCYRGLNERQAPHSGGVIDSGYFGKLIDRTDLEEILVTNVSETAHHAQSSALSMYVVSQTLNPICSIFSSLNFPPSNIYRYWEEATGSIGASSLLGLYIENCGEGCQPNQVINPVIMLNACTDRWTMVHEMLHHNFNVQRKKYKPLDSDEAIIALLMHELNVMEQTIEGYNRLSSDYQGMQVIHALDRVRDLMIRYAYQTSLEEVTIESILLREYTLSRLLYVPQGAVRNAISYIRYSTAAGIDRVAPIKAAAQEISRSAKQSGWARVLRNADTLIAKINAFEDDSSCYQNEALSLYQQATMINNPTESQWARLDNVQPIRTHLHAKTHKIDNIEKELKTILEKIRN